MLNRSLLLAMSAGVLLVLSVGSVSATQAKLTPVDKPVPPFSLQGVDGTTYNTENLHGKTWLINFWAVWCAPCLEELPSLNRAWEALEPHDVGMLAINIGEDADQIEQFLKQHDLKIDFPIVIGDKIRTLGNWGARALPHTVVVSADGKIAYEAVGPREWDSDDIIAAVVKLSQEQEN